MKAVLTRCLFFIAILTGLLAINADAGIIGINNDELLTLYKNDVTIIDIRTEREWRETGVIPGSHLLTLFDDARRVVDPDGWLNKVRAKVKQDQPVILICRVGNRTVPATQFLSKSGYTTVYHVTGGIIPWIRDGLPIVGTNSGWKNK